MGTSVDLLLGIAANPSAPPEVLDRLADLPGAAIAVAGRADLGPEHAARLHAAGDVRVDAALAANLHAPTALRERLAEHADPYVRAAVAGSGHVAERVLVRLALDHHESVRVALARADHATPMTHRALLADTDAEVLLAVVARARLPRERTAAIAAGPDAELRAALAANPHLSAELVERFTDDPSPVVRATVLTRHDVGEGVRERLYAELSALAVAGPWGDPFADAGGEAFAAVIRLDRELAAYAPWAVRLPIDEQVRLLRSPYPFLRRSVARNPALPARVARNLLTDRDTWVRRFAALHPSTAGDVLLAFTRAYDGTGGVRHGYVRHPNFPAAALPGLARAQDERLRGLALDAPALPAASVLALLADPDPYLAHQAVRHPALPLGAMDDILTASGR